MVKMDHLVVTAVVTLNLWLVHGDDYLLVFWQVLFAFFYVFPTDRSLHEPSIDAFLSRLDALFCDFSIRYIS